MEDASVSVSNGRQTDRLGPFVSKWVVVEEGIVKTNLPPAPVGCGPTYFTKFYNL